MPANHHRRLASDAPSLQEQDPRPVSPSQSRTGLPTDGDGAADPEAGDRANGHADPVWRREAHKSYRWRWVPLRLRKGARIVAKWSRGPDPPQIQRIRLWFPKPQDAPARLVKRWLPTKLRKGAALAALLALWAVAFVLLLRRQTAAGLIEGYGVPTSIWCGASFWSDENGCGLNGDACRPFADAVFPFRCRPGCASMNIQTPHVIGAAKVNWMPLVVGGGDASSHVADERVYRADSFICQAAIHAGAIPVGGGCGVAVLRGTQPGFTAAWRNGITSLPFDAAFPKSFSFAPRDSADCGVIDMRWALLAVTAATTALLGIFVSSPAVFFACVFTLLFAHVGLASDPPNAPDERALVSTLVGRFLPSAFVMTVLYRASARKALADLAAPLDKTVLWLGGAWLGALDNLTFSHWIPIARLTPRDVGAQAHGVLALVLIVLIILAIAFDQAYYFRLEGRFRRMLLLYMGICAALLLCVAIPGLHLRLHHYFLAILLLPGTSLQTRPSLFYQGLLVGLFVNGVARWGFDSVLETSAALFGPGVEGVKPPLPNITALAGGTGDLGQRLTLNWALPLPEGWDGVSVLVNDVERAKWYEDAGQGGPSFEWLRNGSEARVREYFRFAYMSSTETGPYTKAGIWEPDGRWEVPGSLERWDDSNVRFDL